MSLRFQIYFRPEFQSSAHGNADILFILEFNSIFYFGNGVDSSSVACLRKTEGVSIRNKDSDRDRIIFNRFG